MRRVTYAGESFLTSDDMAQALVEFTAEIARNTFSESVSVPAITPAGQAMTVDLVIGPSSEVISVPDESQSVFDIGAAADDLRARSKALLAGREPHNALPLQDADTPVQFDEEL